MEEFREIAGASRYLVSKTGSIKNKETGLILKPALDRYGYYKIQIRRDDGSNYYATIHRLVALAWVPGYAPGFQVNHKDGDKKNNHHENLEWVTVRDNIVHSFENLLNKNTSPVVLYDNKDNTKRKFRSLKSLSKYIGIHPSALVPLIRYSDRNPVLSRYRIEVIDENSLFQRANTVNFGSSVFTLDSVNGQIKRYPSILVAAYFTGVRSLSVWNKRKTILIIAGYYFSYERELLSLCSPEKDVETIQKEREAYLLAPYVKRDYQYYLYDYFEERELSFGSIDSLRMFLNKEHPELKTVSKESVFNALRDGFKKKRTGILRGYGIRSGRHGFPWCPRSKEVLMKNRFVGT